MDQVIIAAERAAGEPKRALRVSPAWQLGRRIANGGVVKRIIHLAALVAATAIVPSVAAQELADTLDGAVAWLEREARRIVRASMRGSDCSDVRIGSTTVSRSETVRPEGLTNVSVRDSAESPTMRHPPSCTKRWWKAHNVMQLSVSVGPSAA